MLAMRLRASSRVRMRGERGKLPRVVMSLSVRSIASCGYHFLLVSQLVPPISNLIRKEHRPETPTPLRTESRRAEELQELQEKGKKRGKTYTRNTKILNGWYFMSYNPRKNKTDINSALASKV